jgi:hypothetical protein
LSIANSKGSRPQSRTSKSTCSGRARRKKRLSGSKCRISKRTKLPSFRLASCKTLRITLD